LEHSMASRVWRVIPRPGCPAPCGSIGPQQVDIECVEWDEHYAPLLPASACSAATKPSSNAWPCFSRCVHVDPLLGDDGADGGDDSPVRTVAECVQRWQSGLVKVDAIGCEDIGTDVYHFSPWTPFSCAQECRVADSCTHFSVGHSEDAMRHCILLNRSCGSHHLDAGFDWYRLDGGLPTGARAVHRCMLHDGIYAEAIASNLREDLTIEAASTAASNVVFDATAAVGAVLLSRGQDGVWRAPLQAPRREAVLVGGESIVCDADGACEPGRCDGKAASLQLANMCFVWSPAESWARHFSRFDAQRCLPATAAGGSAPSGCSAPTEREGTWWWWETGVLAIDRALYEASGSSSAWPPEVRLKVASRALALDFGEHSRSILLRGLRFRAAGVRISGNGADANLPAVVDCRFLYAPAGTHAVVRTHWP